jgi:HK97 family phage major capsid protein
VFPEFSSAILEREVGQDLWGLADNYTIGGNSMSFPRVRDTNRTDGNRTGGLQSYWKGEEQTLTASTPQFDTTSLKLNKLTVLVYVTEEMLDDTSVALEQFVSRRVRAELTFGLSNAMFRGTGVGQPLGFLASPALVTVNKETDQTADTINGDNVVKMWSRRLQESESNYVWLINQDCEPQLFNLQLGTSYGTQLVYLPPGGLSGSPYGTLMGRPVISTEFNSTVGDVGDICLVDTKQYLTIGKGGITESVSPHVEFLRDALCYKFTVRVDGRPAFDSPVTPFKGSNTQSGFIALQAR